MSCEFLAIESGGNQICIGFGPWYPMFRITRFPRIHTGMEVFLSMMNLDSREFDMIYQKQYHIIHWRLRLIWKSVPNILIDCVWRSPHLRWGDTWNAMLLLTRVARVFVECIVDTLTTCCVSDFNRANENIQNCHNNTDMWRLHYTFVPIPSIQIEY